MKERGGSPTGTPYTLAGIAGLRREGFVIDSPASPHKIYISQAAFFTGLPRLAPLLAHHLVTSTGDGMPLTDWVEALPEQTRQALQGPVKLIPGCESITIDDFRLWLPDTSKYLCHRQAI